MRTSIPSKCPSEEELEESVNTQRQRHGEPSREMLERAYTSSIRERVIAARAKQKKDKSFNEGSKECPKD